MILGIIRRSIAKRILVIEKVDFLLLGHTDIGMPPKINVESTRAALLGATDNEINFHVLTVICATASHVEPKRCAKYIRLEEKTPNRAKRKLEV